MVDKKSRELRLSTISEENSCLSLQSDYSDLSFECKNKEYKNMKFIPE